MLPDVIRYTSLFVLDLVGALTLAFLISIPALLVKKTNRLIFNVLFYLGSVAIAFLIARAGYNFSAQMALVLAFLFQIPALIVIVISSRALAQIRFYKPSDLTGETPSVHGQPEAAAELVKQLRRFYGPRCPTCGTLVAS